MHFIEVDINLIHRVFSLLSVREITALRQLSKTCRLLYNATHAKIVWINQMELLETQNAVLPAHVLNYRVLDASVLEPLVIRLTSIVDKWQRRDLTPTLYSWITLSYSITWLNVVDGRWVFVALSDPEVSKIACWDLWWLEAGYDAPVAEAFLSGPVHTGQVEAQAEGIVLALGVDGVVPSVIVTTLQWNCDRYVFCELSKIDKSSHVLLLAGSLVGCAVLNGANTPHLVDWKKNAVLDIPAPPDGLDTPSRRSVPHLMNLWKEVLIIIRSISIELYHHSPVDGSVVFVKEIATSTIWEAVSYPTQTSLRLLFVTRLGIESIIIDDSTLQPESSPVLMCLANAPTCNCYGPEHLCDVLYHNVPWYRLSLGQSGRRCLWVSVAGGQKGRYAEPCLITATLPFSSSDSKPLDMISWNPGAADGPALWAFPCIAFDEAIGTTVIGNCFGELAFYDWDQHSLQCFGLARDLSWASPAPLENLLPQIPVSLDTVQAPTVDLSATELEKRTSSWGNDDLHLSSMWTTDWFRRPFRIQMCLWQGSPSDYAWTLRRAFGFPGQVIPQACLEQDLGSTPLATLIFRIGRRLFSFSKGDEAQFKSLPLNDTSGTNRFDLGLATVQNTTCRTAITEQTVYDTQLFNEIKSKETPRNRWLELKQRGGSVNWDNLLCYANHLGLYFD
ncbi:hypothetical protein MIND_00771100 [Mycena indigotica]|uniref:F-box domain-containing protein n=1 Tax=Mycena indigotica TaxID=2126181 RepID=A0A8H6SNH8_9AGAR|nr:uncharacterized protein MIND_00771100 [Mycena indigotica]KAF7302047.1 hypothetical protein MIND_00771100 [Mycena indigotica]